ncbi:MAG: F0F1 ATP synthase subunit gamma [Piscinibacter sp.]|nr:F0F1 ATP synthase subunit gamma [Piscinibacter sp.]
MSGQHALRERERLLGELRQIVQAMKNLAFAELQRVSRAQPALVEARAALQRALHALPADDEDTRSARATTWLVVGAERGFCGAFNARLVEAMLSRRAAEPAARWLVAGTRLGALLPADLPVVALPGCAALDEADAALDAWSLALVHELQAGRSLRLLHHGETELLSVPLWPRPEDDGVQTHGVADTGVAPLRQLALPALWSALRRQMLRLRLLGALQASLEQENRWRLAQMQRAQDHLDELGRQLRRRRAALRQADITNELETLNSSLERALATD